MIQPKIYRKQYKSAKSILNNSIKICLYDKIQIYN